MNQVFWIRKVNNELTVLSKSCLRRLINFMENEKTYQVTLTEVKSKRNSRYKYYWSHILLAATEYHIQSGNNYAYFLGQKFPVTPNTMHLYFKAKYAPLGATTTTEMEDNYFINTYEEQIAEELINHGCPLLTRDEWNDAMKETEATNKAKQIIDELFSLTLNK